MRNHRNHTNIFINSVLRKIRDKKIRERVSIELRAHISDGRDAYVKQGLSEAEALKKSIADTGGAKLIAERFNNIYSPKNQRGMRPALSFKTMLRTPLKTALTFLLIAAASFALFSRVTDYAVTSREMERAENSYRGVAILDNKIPKTNYTFAFSNMPATLDIMSRGYNYVSNSNGERFKFPNTITAEQAEAFTSLHGAAADIRYMTGGVMRDYKRLNPRYSDQFDWGYDYTARFIMEGTFVEAAYFNTPYDLFRQDNLELDFSLEFTDIKNIAGNALIPDGETAYIATLNGDDKFLSYSGAGTLSIALGEEYVSLTLEDNNSRFVIEKNPFGWEFIDGLNAGSRYLIIGRYSPENASLEDLIVLSDELKVKTDYAESQSDAWTNRFLNDKIKAWFGNGFKPRIGDNDTLEYVPSFHALDGLPADYLDSDEFSRVREIIDITEKDLYTFDIVYTSDTRTIPRFNEGKMVISEGRAITPEDVNVCIVSQYFLDTYELNINDKLTVELGGRLFEQHAGMGAVTYIPDRAWNIAETVELEIVGVYLDVDSMHERNADHFTGYSPNTIFAPLSLLPVEIPPDHEIKPGEFSIVIENPRDIAPFLEQAEPLAAELGLKLRFSDGGWANIQEHIDASVRTSLITAVIYVTGAVLALLLSTFLFIARSKKNYAVMRALGMPKKNANRALSLPLAIISFSAVSVGGIIGLVYTSRTAKTALEGFAESASGYVTNASLPIIAIILCLLCEVAFVAVLTALFLRKMAKTPPLTLLQGDVIRAADIAEITGGKAKPSNKPLKTANTHFYGNMQIPQKRNYSTFKHVTAYILRRMRRVKLKTAISLTLAAALTSAMGVLTLTRQTYRELFSTVDVKSTVTKFTSFSIEELYKSELTENLYFYGDFEASLNENNFPVPLTVTNDIERYLNGEYEIEYARGYSDISFFTEFENNALCMLGSGIAETLGLKAGDSISVMRYALFEALNFLFLENEEYRNALRYLWGLDKSMTDEEFQERVKQELQAELERSSVLYKIAGLIKSEDINASQRIYTPSGESAHAVFGYEEIPFAIDFGEFILTDNEMLNELTAYLDGLRVESLRHSQEAAFFTDAAELGNIRRVRDLILLLFPVAVTGAVLIGLTAPGLLILQSSKEAAILRVLGATKKRVRCILMFEQIGLCVIGITLAAGGLVIYNSQLFTRSAETLALCGALYLLGCICAGFAASAAATKRKVLVLLQEKE